MKLTITGSELTVSATWCASISGANPQRPIAGGVMIETDNTQLESARLSATDFDTFGTAAIGVGLYRADERYVVSARLLAAIAKTLRATDEVTLECADGDTGLTLRCGRSRWVLPLMDAATWPDFPDLGDPVGRIRGEVLTRALSRVLPAVATDEDTPTVTGVAFDIAAGVLTLAATDRRQIAAAEVEWQPAVGTADIALIVPTGLLKATAAVIGDTDEVELRTDGNTVGFACAQHRITGRLIDGTFSPWRSVMGYPKSNPTATVAVDLTELRHAVAQASATANRGGKVPDLLRLVFTGTEIEVSLASESQQATDAAAVVDVLKQSGDPPTVGVSHDCLSGALAALGSPGAVFTFGQNRKRGFLLQPADSSGTVLDDGYTHMLAPRKLPTRPSV